MKKRIFLIGILLLGLMSIKINNVKANPLEGDANSAGGSVNEVNPAYGNYWNGYQGIRVYITNTSGALQSSVIDYSNTSGLGGYINNGNKTKIDYRGSSSISPSSTSYSYRAPIKPLPNFICSSSSCNISSDVIYSYFKGMSLETFKRLLSDIGFSGDVEKMAEKSYYLVVEPIAYFTHNNKKYALTATETALFLSRSQANTPRWVNDNNYCVSCISVLTHQNLPLSIYIKDSHLGFTGENPSVRIMESGEITGNNGLGIGIFWLDEFIQPKEENPECQPSISNPGFCGVTGSYKDPDDWNRCIYTDKYLYSRINNWCSVYCREEVETVFPGEYLTAIPAGYHFLWEPFEIYGEKECRTQIIDLPRWKTTWKGINDSLPGLYDSWQWADRLAKAQAQGYSNNGPSSSCDCRVSLVKKYYWYDSDGDGIDDTQDYTEECPNRNYYDLMQARGTARYKGQTRRPDSYCSNEQPRNYAAEAASAQSSYISTWNSKDSLEKALMQCNQWPQTNLVKYNLEPKLTVEFEYLYDSYYIPLVSNIVSQHDIDRWCIANPKNCTGSIYGHGKVVLKSYVQCPNGREGCTPTYDFDQPLNTLMIEQKFLYLDYSYPNDTFRYVLKDTGISQNNIPDHSNYYDIGYANLPVHYTTLPGVKPITLNYSNIGEEAHFDPYIDDKLYRCTYVVTDGISPDPNGGKDDPDPEDYGCINPGCDNKAKELKVIYRTISLADPFPRIDGKGRVPGSNWLPDNINSSYYTTSNYPNDLVSKYILKNRGVENNNVYNKEPMYEIELNPVRIKEIREYNKKNEYNDFKLSCTAGKGIECKSQFIRETYRNYFTTGITGNTTETCGISNDWYLCDKNDRITR